MKQYEEIISNQKKEICDLKESMIQLKNSLQDKESCYLSYFGKQQGNYPYAKLHVKANEQTKLPFYHFQPNSIVSIEHHQDGTKITFLKSGMYLLMFNILTSTVFQEVTTIRVYTTGKSGPHYLNSYLYFQPNISSQVISGHKLCHYEKEDYIYVVVSSSKAFDITGNSTVNTSFEIIKT